MTGQWCGSVGKTPPPERLATVVTRQGKVVLLGISNDAPLTYRRRVAIISMEARSTIRRNDWAVTLVSIQYPAGRRITSGFTEMDKVVILGFSNDAPLTYRRLVVIIST